jgi:methionine--tRNA ligase beta chain
MSTSVAPALFGRSLALVEAWMAELTPKTARVVTEKTAATPAAAAAPAGDAKKAASPRGGNKAEAQPEAERSSMSRVALLCGRVLEVTAHPDSDKLYVEKIDLGEPTPRTIISGLREHISVEAFLGRNVVVVANLEPRKMRGIESAGMVLCASTEGKGEVKLLDVPEGVAPGERITFPGHDGAAEPVLKKKLAKCWDDVAPLLKTDSQGVATFSGLPFVTSKGPVTSPLPGAVIS